MESKEFLFYHAEMCEKMKDLVKRKNADYSGASESAFANFEASERMDVTSVEQGILVRVLDKFSRINCFLKQGVLLVEDEKIEDTIQDMCNYLIILSAYIKSKKG